VKRPVAVFVVVCALVCALTFLAGCGHKPMKVAVPPAPSVEQQPSEESSEASPSLSPRESIDVAPDAKPLLVETGIASWYGAPYHNRRGSNGEIYDMHAMTAAHRTLPLGSIVRVTCVENGSSAVVRITDRGPFVEGRIIDLSQAAAQKIGLVQKGTAKVRLEVLKTPQPIAVGGRWAVQIGAFQNEDSARDLADRLSRRYHTAKVLTFNSPVGDWWVRVRVKDDERGRAEEVMRAEKSGEGAFFLVRLD
jgi:rare lipoprotein A